MVADNAIAGVAIEGMSNATLTRTQGAGPHTDFRSGEEIHVDAGTVEVADVAAEIGHDVVATPKRTRRFPSPAR